MWRVDPETADVGSGFCSTFEGGVSCFPFHRALGNTSKNREAGVEFLVEDSFVDVGSLSGISSNLSSVVEEWGGESIGGSIC